MFDWWAFDLLFCRFLISCWVRWGSWTRTAAVGTSSTTNASSTCSGRSTRTAGTNLTRTLERWERVWYKLSVSLDKSVRLMNIDGIRRGSTRTTDRECERMRRWWDDPFRGFSLRNRRLQDLTEHTKCVKARTRLEIVMWAYVLWNIYKNRIIVDYDLNHTWNKHVQVHLKSCIIILFCIKEIKPIWHSL